MSDKNNKRLSCICNFCSLLWTSILTSHTLICRPYECKYTSDSYILFVVVLIYIHVLKKLIDFQAYAVHKFVANNCTIFNAIVNWNKLQFPFVPFILISKWFNELFDVVANILLSYLLLFLKLQLYCRKWRWTNKVDTLFHRYLMKTKFYLYASKSNA